MNTSFCPNHRLPWGEIFYSLVNLCGLKNKFPSSSVPTTYARDKVCGHIFHVGLEDTATHAMYLTMLEGSKDLENTLDSHVPAYFIYCRFFKILFGTWVFSSKLLMILIQKIRVWKVSICSHTLQTVYVHAPSFLIIGTVENL